ncbi:hypothetical protein G6F37_011245 [Rhizopus arrhizus]|nr:hypothetical protein G6F38_011280 [Rhizopus arrhizus]KAG1150251.1 hypothetical protein G6F37_011245 [Rhizopus arrhizus]
MSSIAAAFLLPLFRKFLMSIESSMITTVKNGIIFPKNIYFGDDTGDSFCRVLCFFENRPTTLLLQINLTDLVRSSLPWKEIFDVFEPATDNPIIVSFTGDIDFMRTFEVMGTCSTLPRIITADLHFEKIYDDPPATLIQKAIMVGGDQYLPKYDRVHLSCFVMSIRYSLIILD